MAIFLPPSTTIHYKSAFDIEPFGIEPCTDIRRIIRDWCSARRSMTAKGREEIGRGWFFTGDTEQHECGDNYIRVATNAGNFSRTNPQHWAFELIHNDERDSSRIWSLNIALKQETESKLRFACLLRYATRAGYIGPEGEVPVPSVPRFIRELINNTNFRCSKFNLPLYHTPYDIGVFGWEHIAKQICNTNRRLPIVLAVTQENVDCPVDIKMLHSMNIGNMNLYTITSDRDLTHLNNMLPYDHRMLPGMLRIYFRFTPDTLSGYRHRFYRKEDVVSKHNGIINEITFALSKNAQNFLPDEVIEIRQVIDQRRLHEISEMSTSNSRDDREYIRLLEYELAEKVGELSKKDEELSKKDEDVLNLEISLGDAQEKERILSWKASQYDAQFIEISKLNKMLSDGQAIFELPESLEDVLSLANERFGGKISIHENAITSARKYKLSTEMKVVREAWKMLSHLHFTMYEIKFIENNAELEKAFLDRTGIQFAKTEGSATKKNSKLMKLRQCFYNGDEVDFCQHLKSSVCDDFRLHFAFLEEERKILICHCGEHLPSARTRHMN